jgi:hypothetical protein
MRVIRTLLFSLCTVAVVVVVGGLGYREFLLIQATSQLTNSYEALKDAVANSAQYVKECSLKGLTGGSTQVQFQLRFLTPSTYVLEVVCGASTLNNLVIRTESLPQFVTKRPGGSGGVFVKGEHGGVGITVWGRSRDVVVLDNMLTIQQPDAIPLAVGPRTVCGGLAYHCCPEQTHQGVGDVFVDAIDCPRTCYASCQARPIVLSLITDPASDPQTRETVVQRDTPVTVSYVVDPATTNEAVSITLDYGDGSVQTFLNFLLYQRKK